MAGRARAVREETLLKRRGLIIFFCAWDKSLNLVYRQTPQYGGVGRGRELNASPGRFPRKESSLKCNLLRKDYAPARSVAATNGLLSVGRLPEMAEILYASAAYQSLVGARRFERERIANGVIAGNLSG